jgi:hypothetical protein
MNDRFQRAALVAREPDTRTAFNDALESAAMHVDIDGVGARLVRRTPNIGVASWRQLAFELCRWAEQSGVLDRMFPLAAVEEGNK